MSLLLLTLGPEPRPQPTPTLFHALTVVRHNTVRFEDNVELSFDPDVAVVSAHLYAKTNPPIEISAALGVQIRRFLAEAGAQPPVRAEANQASATFLVEPFSASRLLKLKRDLENFANDHRDIGFDLGVSYAAESCGGLESKVISAALARAKQQAAGRGIAAAQKPLYVEQLPYQIINGVCGQADIARIASPSTFDAAAYPVENPPMMKVRGGVLLVYPVPQRSH